MSLADDLRKLQELRQEGALSDAEFEQAKQKLLDGGAAQTHLRLDPGLSRAAERYTNTSSAISVVGIVVFLVVAGVILFGACSALTDRGNGRLGGACDEPGITCTR
jgi:hypothetical protein